MAEPNAFVLMGFRTSRVDAKSAVQSAVLPPSYVSLYDICIHGNPVYITSMSIREPRRLVLAETKTNGKSHHGLTGRQAALRQQQFNT